MSNFFIHFFIISYFAWEISGLLSFFLNISSCKIHKKSPLLSQVHFLKFMISSFLHFRAWASDSVPSGKRELPIAEAICVFSALRFRSWRPEFDRDPAYIGRQHSNIQKGHFRSWYAESYRDNNGPGTCHQHGPLPDRAAHHRRGGQACVPANESAHSRRHCWCTAIG